MCVKASVVAQMVNNLPAMPDSWVWSQGWEDPVEDGMATTGVFLPGESKEQRSLVVYCPWGCEESDTTELLIQHTKMYQVLLLLFISFITDQLTNIFNFFLDLWLSVFSSPSILILFHEVECCYVLKVCLYPTAKFFLWNLIPKLMVFESEAFGRC